MYGDFVVQVDHVVGQVLDALKEADMSENTLVIFSSDNGPVWFDKDTERFRHRSAGPLRGIKASAWVGGHRMPFIARWPGRVPAGKSTAHTIAFADVLATVADAAGKQIIPQGAAEDSVSFLKCLYEQQKGPFREASVQQSGKKALAIRKGKWKLIVHGDNKRELFNLHTDIGEKHNVIETHPKVAIELALLLQSYLDKGRSTPGKAQPLEYKISLDEVRYNKK